MRLTIFAILGLSSAVSANVPPRSAETQKTLQMIREVRRQLPHDMLADVPLVAEGPERRAKLADVAKKYRALQNATSPADLKRRAMLAPLVGDIHLLHKQHMPADSYKNPNGGKRLRGLPDGQTKLGLDANGDWVAKKIIVATNRNLGTTANTIAHEMKHARDRARENVARAEAVADAAALAKLAPGAEHDALAKKLAREEAFTSRAGEETRAYREGAFAEGNLGMPLHGEHLFGTIGNDPDYPPKTLARKTIDGYVLGSKFAMRLAPKFRDANPVERARLAARINTYLAGYTEVLTAQATQLLDTHTRTLPKVTDAAHALAMREQSMLILHRGNLHDAGRRDAELDLPPLGRLTKLLR